MAYVDEIGEEIEARGERYRRAVRCIRGWLRQERRASGNVAAIVAFCIGFGVAFTCVLEFAGWNDAVPRAGVAVLCTWPVYLALFSTLARREAEQFDWPSIDYASVDDALTRKADAREESFAEVLRSVRTSGSSAPNAGPALILLGLLTLGTFLIYDLIRSSPALLAEKVLDNLIHQSSGMVSRFGLGTGRNHYFAATSIHFLSLTAVTMLLACGFEFLDS
jgi:hypothetical protein